MKKVLLLLTIAAGFGALAQTSMQVTLHSTGYTISPNENIYLRTKANSTSITEIDIKNIGTGTNKYKVKRNDVLLNTDALAYFCFAGNCYTELILTSPDADTLAPGQSASELKGDFKLLSADLIEGPAVGKSDIEYTFFNVDVPTDKISFTLKYNATAAVGIKENSKSVSGFEIFPNPAKETATVHLNSTKSLVTNLIIFNALGEIVQQKEVALTEGKNKIDLDIENLNSGIYFVSIKNGETSISKKLIIN